MLIKQMFNVINRKRKNTRFRQYLIGTKIKRGQIIETRIQEVVRRPRKKKMKQKKLQLAGNRIKNLEHKKEYSQLKKFKKFRSREGLNAKNCLQLSRYNLPRTVIQIENEYIEILALVRTLTKIQ